MNTNKPIIGLTCGEATGIGSELVAKALQSEEVRNQATWVLIGDERVVKQGEEIAKCSLNYNRIENVDEIRDLGGLYLIDLHNLDPLTYQQGTLSLDSGRISGETLQYALELARLKKLDGIVYAPLNKEALHRGGFDFEDDIHFLAAELGCENGFSEVNIMENLWVTRVTSHVALKQVPQMITKERVGSIIRFANETLKRAGFEQPRIVVAALNPHAGEGGMFGTEEIDAIAPAVREAREEGIHVNGPFPADTLFLRLKSQPFDCLVSMYHDQAQTGMKLLGFHKGVTYSGGLPVVLTTPAHGTAFDIAGKGVANPGAMEAAMKMAVRLSSNNQ